MVDGGISSNKFIIRFLAELLGKPVINIGIEDVSALGAAYLAGLQQKIFSDLNHISKLNTVNKITTPLGDDNIKTWYQGWQQVVGSPNKYHQSS